MNNEQLIPMVSITVYYRGIKKRQRSIKTHSIELIDLKESDFTDLNDYKAQAMVKLTEDAKSYDRPGMLSLLLITKLRRFFRHVMWMP